MKLSILHSCQIVFWGLVTVSCFAQDSSTDNLKELLRKHPAKDSILLELAQTNKLMGTYRQTIQPAEAINYFRQSLEIYKEAGNREEVVQIHQMIAATYYYMDEYDKQLFHLKKALQEALELDNAKLEINILYQLTKVYCYLNNYEPAMEYSLMALKESHNHDQWMLDEIMIGQAEIEFQKGNFQKSIDLSKDVLTRVREKGQIQLEINCSYNIAACLMGLNQYHEARDLLEKYPVMTHPDDDTFDNYKVLQLMIVLDSKTGNFANAFRLQRKLEQLTAKNNSLEQLQETWDMMFQVEMQQLNMKLIYLQSALLEQNNRTAKTNTVLIVLILVACGEIFFFALLRRSFKKLKLEKIRFIDEETIFIEKQKSLSGKSQSLLQKQESLQEINHHLTALNRSKTELFKAISHDLQKPLIQLQQNLTNLMTNIGEDQFRRATAVLTTMVGDISLLLENLLQWSKYQSQGIHAKPQYTELIALVNDVVGQQKYSATEKKITISNTLEHNIFVYADEDMVRSLLKTILQNIVKLSKPGAIITIYGNKDKQNGWLKVNYTGEMPLKRTFLKQPKAVKYGSKATELGKAIILGWMLCRTLMQVNNGSISVEDISTDSFYIILNFPLEEAAKFTH